MSSFAMANSGPEGNIDIGLLGPWLAKCRRRVAPLEGLRFKLCFFLNICYLIYMTLEVVSP